MKLAFVVAVAVLIATGCKPHLSPASAATLGGHEAALDACLAQAANYAEYERCADDVDARFGIPREKDGGR